MLSTQVFTVLALLAASVSGMSIGHPSNHELVSRRHAAGVTRDSVLSARGARVRDMSDRHLEAVKRENHLESFKRNVPRKRGMNQRRCAAKSSTSTLSTSTAAPTPTPAPSADPVTTSEVTTSEASTTEVTSTTPAVLIKSSTKSKHATSTKTTAKATSTPASSSSGGTFTGEATFYGTGLGSCGITNKDSDMIVAVSHLLYDGFQGFAGGNPNNNPVCGKKIIATYKGKSVTVTVTDRCTGCALRDLDFAPKAFDKLADESLGRLQGMTWKFV